MRLLRRDLLKVGLAHTISSCIPFESNALHQIKVKTGPSILQGATDNTKTQFSIVYKASAKLDIFVSNAAGHISKSDEVEVLSYPGHAQQISKVYFSKLQPHQTYYLNIIDLDTKSLIDVREFKTLDLESQSLRFAVCSCMDKDLHSPEIWKNLVSQNPEVIFFIGDQVYADRGGLPSGASPALLWRQFCEARATLEIYFSKKLIPIFATWDDHDFGANNGTSVSYPFVKESQLNFLSFVAQRESHCQGLIRGPGVSSALKFRSQLFVLSDGRSFRKEINSQERFAHWGEEQEKWITDLIQKHQGPTWFMNGTQIFPSFFVKESVSYHHPVQFQGFLEQLKPLASRVVFISGDVHFSEISEIETQAVGYQTYEMTSSSMHSKNFANAPDFIPNPRRIAATGHRNFLMIDAKAQGYGVEIKTVSVSTTGQQLFQKSLIVI